MNKHKKTVSYVFGAGRLKKLTSGEKIAREFFYGYYFFSENKNVPIIEMKLPNDSKNVLLNYLDKKHRNTCNSHGFIWKKTK